MRDKVQSQNEQIIYYCNLRKLLDLIREKKLRINTKMPTSETVTKIKIEDFRIESTSLYSMVNWNAFLVSIQLSVLF
jgi:hypothetical protein